MRRCCVKPMFAPAVATASAPRLPRSLRVLYRPLASGVDGFKSLTSEQLKQSSDAFDRAKRRSEAYAQAQDMRDGQEAARLRREKIIRDAALNNPYLNAQSHRSSASGLDAQVDGRLRKGV